MWLWHIHRTLQPSGPTLYLLEAQLWDLCVLHESFYCADQVWITALGTTCARAYSRFPQSSLSISILVLFLLLQRVVKSLNLKGFTCVMTYSTPCWHTTYWQHSFVVHVYWNPVPCEPKTSDPVMCVCASQSSSICQDSKKRRYWEKGSSGHWWYIDKN